MIRVYPRYTTHRRNWREIRAASTNVFDRASRADARGRPFPPKRARSRRTSRSIARRRRRESATERGPRGEEAEGTIPSSPRRRHDDDRDLRDDERAIDDAGGDGERTNEIVRAVWRRREG